MDDFTLPCQFIRSTQILSLVKSLPILDESCSLDEAARFFCRIETDSVALVNKDHKFIGILESSRLFKAVYQNPYTPDPAKEFACYPKLVTRDNENLTRLLNDMLKQGVEKAIVIDERYRFLGVVYLSDIVNAVELESIFEELNQTKKLQATLEAIVENPYEGLIVIDENSTITMINKFYADALGLNRKDIIGKNILEVTPHSQMPDIIKTGQASIGDFWEVNNHEFMIMRIPIMKDGKVIGAIGKSLFKDIPLAIQFAKKLIKLENDLLSYKQELRNLHHSRSTIDDLIGKSAKITAVKDLILRAAKTSSTILIIGESGTGKEVVSNLVHNLGSRKDRPFIKINCSAIPENLLESELFGYVEGAFTGARKGGKPGKFEQANHGTLFLDEIGDMSISMQTKILRAIQEREIERVGGTQPIQIDVRIIAATHRDLNKMITENKFRLDLFYRLNVFVIELPPLRQRLEDIKLLTSHLLIRLKQRLSTSVEGVSPQAMELLNQHHWPGNIRELENVLERAINIADEPVILPEHLPLKLRLTKLNSTINPSPMNFEDVRLAGQINLEEALLAIEKELILNAMLQAKGNKAKVASALGIHRTALYRKLARHQLL